MEAPTLNCQVNGAETASIISSTIMRIFLLAAIKRLFVPAALAVVLLTGSAAAETFDFETIRVIGAGTSTCGAFVRRPPRDTGPEALRASWGAAGGSRLRRTDSVKVGYGMSGA